jgi:hypothetical protein
MRFPLLRGAVAFGLSAIALTGAEVTPADLRAHVALLSSDLLEGRSTPSRGLDLAAEYIAIQFRRAGLSAQPDGSYFQAKSPGERNVIGVLPGVDTRLMNEYVIVSAHYDHTGVCGKDEPDRICNGANDNASGVASLIETARWLSANPPRRTVLFLAFFGEELELHGSRYYAENPVYPIQSTVAHINFEQTGRTDDLDGASVRTLSVTGYDYSEVAQILAGAAAPLNVTIENRPKWSDAAFARSDNEALAKKGVPAHTLAVAFNFPDYHRPGDEWEKLDYENMAAVTQAAAAGVAAIANREQPPRWYQGAPFGGAYATEKSQPVAPPAPVAPPESVRP